MLTKMYTKTRKRRSHVCAWQRQPKAWPGSATQGSATQASVVGVRLLDLRDQKSDDALLMHGRMGGAGIFRVKSNQWCGGSGRCRLLKIDF